VQLPANMSLRAIERSRALMEELERNLGPAISKIAYVSAFCFMFVGAAYTIANLTTVPSFQKAELIGSFDSSNMTTSGLTTSGGVGEQTIINGNPSDDQIMSGGGAVQGQLPGGGTTALNIGKSEFHFLSTIPDNVVEPTLVSFEVTNVNEVKAKLITVGTTQYMHLPVTRVSGDKYRVDITMLAPNYYDLRILVKPSNGESTYVRTQGEFFIGSKVMEEQFNSKYESASSSDEIPDSSDLVSPAISADGDGDGTATESNNTSGIDAHEQSDTPTNDTNETEEPTTAISNDIHTATSTITNTEAIDNTITFSLVRPMISTLSNTATLRFNVSQYVSFIEVYARPVNSLQARFIGLATLRLGQWSIIFDSKNLPNGEYEFYGKTKHDGQLVLTKSEKLWVKNVVATVATTTTVIKTQEQRSLITVSEQGDVIDTSSDPNQTPIENTLSTTETKSIFIDNREDLNTLFESYAVAKQSGDESLIRAAQLALDKKREDIMLRNLTEEKIQNTTDQLHNDLAVQMSTIQNKIDTFEALRKERSAGNTAVDSDSDGISDIDEQQLYSTDPTAADTDNDGITDGVEIMRGYNPLDSVPEVTIRFESPKESVGLVRADVLTIEEVTPIVEETNPTTLSVAAEIRGKGLPNSFVTLYIFSTPTVVTVKTDADGMFVYTFDKEIEDGQHDVYVAITDNAGEIIAQSNPFSFVKEAQAFTPVQAAEDNIVSPESVTESTASQGYGLAVGVGILAFGLILLLLGLSLRRSTEETIIITENDSTSVGREHSVTT
jgi:hypothetical protein